MTPDFSALEIWTRRRALLLVAMLLGQFGVSFAFQDFRAILDNAGGASPVGSAFAVSGGPPADQEAAARNSFIPTVRQQPGTVSAVTFRPTGGDVVSEDETAPASAGGPVRRLAQPILPAPAPEPTVIRNPQRIFDPLPQPPVAPQIQQLDGISPAPEPGAWVMFILGFGLIGLTLRGQRAAADRAAHGALGQVG
jgi:hypothetical protein